MKIVADTSRLLTASVRRRPTDSTRHAATSSPTSLHAPTPIEMRKTVCAETSTDSSRSMHATAAFWNVPFYLILNTALGGGWPGSVNASTILPARHRIDYVRVSRPVA